MGDMLGTCRRYSVSGVAGWEVCVLVTDDVEPGVGAVVSGVSGLTLFSCL